MDKGDKKFNPHKARVEGSGLRIRRVRLCPRDLLALADADEALTNHEKFKLPRRLTLRQIFNLIR